MSQGTPLPPDDVGSGKLKSFLSTGKTPVIRKPVADAVPLPEGVVSVKIDGEPCGIASGFRRDEAGNIVADTYVAKGKIVAGVTVALNDDGSVSAATEKNRAGESSGLPADAAAKIETLREELTKLRDEQADEPRGPGLVTKDERGCIVKPAALTDEESPPVKVNPDGSCSPTLDEAGINASLAAAETKLTEHNGETIPAGLVPGPDLLATAWGIIANVCGGNWEITPPAWRKAAEDFRERFFSQALEPEKPNAPPAAGIQTLALVGPVGKRIGYINRTLAEAVGDYCSRFGGSPEGLARSRLLTLLQVKDYFVTPDAWTEEPMPTRFKNPNDVS